MTFFQTGYDNQDEKKALVTIRFFRLQWEENLPALIEQTMVHLPQFAGELRLLLLTMAVAITPKQWRTWPAKYHQVKVVSHHTNLGYGAAPQNWLCHCQV